MSGLGAGGNGIFALDVTDLNSPKQLFAIENDPTNKVVKHWNIDGQKMSLVMQVAILLQI